MSFRVSLKGNLIWSLVLAISTVLAWVGPSPIASGYTANKVWFEFRPSGIYRVHVNYTVPELKEFREAYVEFRRKKDAERFYYDLIRGADFFPPDPTTRRFVGPSRTPEPW